MNYTLILDEITDRERKELARFESNRVEVGREPGPAGIALPAGAVSRVHAIFMRFRYTWFFVDNGSTNGSWINGQRVFNGQYHIVRPGTVIQMADRAFQLSTIHPDGSKVQHLHWLDNLEDSQGRSVFLFHRGQFQQEFEIPPFGRSIALGDEDTDVVLPDYKGLRPAIIIERRGAATCVYSIAKRDEFEVNGRSHIELVTVEHNDVIIFRDYSLIINDPSTASDPVPAVEETDAVGQVLDTIGIKGWNEESDDEVLREENTGAPMFGAVETPSFQDPEAYRNSLFAEHDRKESPTFQRPTPRPVPQDPRKSGFFGGMPEEQRDETGAYIPSERSGMFASIVPQQKSFFETLEEKIILIVGLVMLAALIGLVVWWILHISM